MSTRDFRKIFKNYGMFFPVGKYQMEISEDGFEERMPGTYRKRHNRKKGCVLLQRL